MNDALERSARELGLDAPQAALLRLRFGHDCVQRVRHLLESGEVIECLDVLGAYLQGSASKDALDQAAQRCAALANAHPGSRSIDGCGHAAVSATYAAANALAGKALQAADYAAYASVYGEGGYGAVGERSAFEPEFAWQVECLRRRAQESGIG